MERSRAQLTDALGEMLRCPDGRTISVSALCATAGVSRPTFYQHFTSIDDVAVASVQRRFARLLAEVPEGPDAPYQLLVAFLTDLDADRGPWRRTIGGDHALVATREAVETWFASRFAERSPSASPVEVRYAAAGFLSAVRSWLQDDGPERPSAAALAADLVEIAHRVLGPAHACGEIGAERAPRLEA